MRILDVPGFKRACAEAHELCFRLEDDIVVAVKPGGPWRAEPRFHGARPVQLRERLADGATVVVIVRPPRAGSIGGAQSCIDAPLCPWCHGGGFIVTLGGRRPCRVCGGSGVKL